MDNDNGFARLDYQLNTNTRLSIHYTVVDARDRNVLVGDTLDGGGIGGPSGGHNTFLRDQSLVGSLNSLLKPSVVKHGPGAIRKTSLQFSGYDRTTGH